MSSKLLSQLRKPRIGKVAIFDLSLAMVGGAYVGQSLYKAPIAGAIMSIPVGIIVHQLFNIKTPLNQSIFTKGSILDFLNEPTFVGDPDTSGDLNPDNLLNRELEINVNFIDSNPTP